MKLKAMVMMTAVVSQHKFLAFDLKYLLLRVQIPYKGLAFYFFSLSYQWCILHLGRSRRRNTCEFLAKYKLSLAAYCKGKLSIHGLSKKVPVSCVGSSGRTLDCDLTHASSNPAEIKYFHFFWIISLTCFGKVKDYRDKMAELPVWMLKIGCWAFFSSSL